MWKMNQGNDDFSLRCLDYSDNKSTMCNLLQFKLEL